MTHLDLFSGIGGFAIAAQWAGYETRGFSEIDPFCSEKLNEIWPDIKNYGNIKTAKFTDLGRMDLLTGGFPCQPFSVAGKQKGREDDRHLWPEMLRVISEVQPTRIVGENVTGIIGMELDNVLSDLETVGYTTWPLVIPACAVGAPHRRDRIWIIAHFNASNPDSGRCNSSGQQRKMGVVQESRDNNSRTFEKSNSSITDPNSTRGAFRLSRSLQGNERISGIFNNSFEKCNWWEDPWPKVAAELCGVDDGLPNRTHRLKALGNSIVPQVAYQIIKAIS